MIKFKTVEKTGAKGFSVGSGNVPQNGVVYYDGSTAPEGWEETESPVTGATVYSNIIAYAETMGDDGSTDTNRPFDTVQIDASKGNYITADLTNNELIVTHDFLAVLVPWCETEQTSSNYNPEIGIKINGEWFIQKIVSDRNTQGAIGGLAYTLDYIDEEIRSNCIVKLLKEGDTIAFSKHTDHGWSIGHLKIYKLFGTVDGGDMEDLITDMGVISSTVTESTALIDEG